MRLSTNKIRSGADQRVCPGFRFLKAAQERVLSGARHGLTGFLSPRSRGVLTLVSFLLATGPGVVFIPT